jgi:hypothetical protein
MRFRKTPKGERERVDFDLDAEFKALEQTVNRWEHALSREALFHEDYRELRERIVSQLENIIIALEDEDEEEA